MSVTKSGLAFIFDFDNTLVKTNAFIAQQMRRAVDRIQRIDAGTTLIADNTRLTDTVLNRVLKANMPFEDIFKTLFSGTINGLPTWEVVLTEYRRDSLAMPYEATEGAVECVTWLQAHDIPMAISSSRLRGLKERLEQAGFTLDQFTCIDSLPHPDSGENMHESLNAILRPLLKKSADPMNLVYVGEHWPHDRARAKLFSAEFIAVTSGLTTRDEFLLGGVPADNILDSLGEMKFRFGHRIA